MKKYSVAVQTGTFATLFIEIKKKTLGLLFVSLLIALVVYIIIKNPGRTSCGEETDPCHHNPFTIEQYLISILPFHCFT